MTTRAVGIVLLMMGSTAASGAAQPDGLETDASRDLYQRACAACHGPDGRGAPTSQVGFDVPLPDFTDCRFATREPDGDWLAVTHDGGPVRGFDRMMPAFGRALSADEIQGAIDHIRTLCTERAWPRGELNLPRALVTEKAYPEDEAVLTTIVDAEGPGAVTNELLYEKRFGPRDQIEIAVPLEAAADGRGHWSGAVGDIAVGWKRALFHSLPHGSIVSVTGEIVFPTGDEAKGLGNDTAIVEPFATYGQILPLDSFVHLQGGFELPLDPDAAEREAFWRATLGKTFTQGAFGRSWSPMIEILGAKALVDGESPQWDVLPQVQITLNQRQHIMVNLGVRLPVTDADERPTQVLAYLLWDWFDGGFFEGWSR